MSDDALDIPEEQRGRQAVASLGGYAHQLFTTLLAWMRIESDETLLVEVAEDYAVLTSGALTMTQVKRETTQTSVTLRREDARKAILSLWQFGEANPERDVRLHFLSTAPAGKERGVKFPDGADGISYWARVAIGQDVTPLRQFLLGLDWPSDFATFLAEVDDETLRSRLFRRLVWITGAEPTEVAIDTLSARLEILAVERGLLPSDGARALPQLLFDLLQVVLRDDRRLGRLDFERAWEKATTIAMSFGNARMMSGGATVVGPDYGDLALDPLPQRLSTRAGTVDRLTVIAQSGAVPWIHGSSGLGKSRLATLLASRWGGLWHIVRLRGLLPAEIRQSLREAVAALDRPGLAGVVLDDLPVPLVEPWRRFIGTIASEAARLGLALVVTGERKPLAPATDEFGPWRLEPVAAPYLDIGEVSEIVAAAGGDPETWVEILYITCGSGHPLFVDARIAGLASRDWPNDERLAGLLDDVRVEELDDVRAGVALRLLDELDPDAHTLLLRLSVIGGTFDRELVMAVAETHRPLPLPGALLDFLIGPWIESAGRNRLKLSPLLGSAGATGLGNAERTSVRNAVVDNLVARKPLGVEFLSQLLIQALAARNMRGLTFIAGAVLTADNRHAVARACIPLGFLMSKDGRLVPENPMVSASLRLAQVIAVTAEPSHSALRKVLEEADVEFAMLFEPVRSGLKYTMLLSLLSSEEADVVPSVWMPRLLEFIAIIEAGSAPSELTVDIGRVDLGGLTEDQFFFMMRTNRIDKLDPLNELFCLLDGIDPVRRRSWLAASTKLLGGPPLFIQAVWSKLAMAGTLDASRAVGIYRRLAALAQGWQERVAAVECHRATAVLLDEYLDDSEGALAQLDAAEELYPGDQGLVRTRATVLAHAGQHEEASKILSEILTNYSADEPLERALTLQAAATSTAKAGDHRQAAALYLKAHVASEGVVSIEPGIRVGLLCDAAVELGAVNDWPAALRTLGDAHIAAEALLSDDSDRSWFAVQAVSRVALWLNATHEGRPTPNLQDYPGTWSLLNPTIPEDKTGGSGLDSGLANAALLEARLRSSTELVDRFGERERGGLVTPLSALALRHGQLITATDLRDVPMFVDILPQFVAASRAALEAKAMQKVDDAVGAMVTPSEDGDETEWQAARQVTSELLVELILDGEPEALEAAIDRLKGGNGLEDLFRKTDGSQDYIAHALQAVGWLIAPGYPDPESLVHATVTLFQWLSVSTRASLCARISKEVRHAWREVVAGVGDAPGRESTSHLISLLDAGNGDLADIAKIGLAGADAFGVQIHPTMRARLREMS